MAGIGNWCAGNGRNGGGTAADGPELTEKSNGWSSVLARENGWGNERIEGELLKLGCDVSDETVATILRRHGIPPVPDRDTSPSWRRLMTHYKDQLLACDFFTVETLFLQTI